MSGVHPAHSAGEVDGGDAARRRVIGEDLGCGGPVAGVLWGEARKAFVADGAECNWTVQKRWFSDFVAIIDFIHVLSYVFAAATAGRPFGQGWAVYVRWIGLVWQGSVGEVIPELERRQEELGPPDKGRVGDQPATSSGRYINISK